MKTVAIYSRKSKFTGKGESIENQIQICKDYINTTIKEPVEFLIFEDEGFSGGNLDRPQFKQLMNNISHIDILICYRLDRISRNVADFSSTLEMLQENKCDFISVKEQFDTSSPMGRAMIYIASVFAQLERETIAERVKDNMLEMAKNGHWTGGKIPIGFKSTKTKYIDENGIQKTRPQLIIDEYQSNFVKLLYEKYLELGSLHKLESYIAENNIRSEKGILFEKSTLKIILQNTIYVKSNSDVIEYLHNNNWNVYGDPDNIHSLLTYNKTEQSKKNGKYIKKNKDISERLAAVSSIEGFIDAELWLKVQKQFEDNKDSFPRLGKTHNALLVGKLKCGNCKEYMLIQHGRISPVTGEKLFYYVCSLKRKSHKKLCNNKNAKASEIENLVLLKLKLMYAEKSKYMATLKSKYNNKQINNFDIDIKVLEKKLTDNKSIIDGLVTKLALTKDKEVIDILMDKISSVKKEANEISVKIQNMQNEIQKQKLDVLNLELIEDMLNKCSKIDKLPREEQKQLIDILVDVIYYYGPDDNNPKSKIEIKFVGDIDLSEINNSASDMLQNCSPSMTCIKKNDILSKLF
ncbi:recombinase family protein [Clostridium butyricum]|uniref:recombinase family protein n=1 Tax=Clostridium butyricum TaxID=1492 RepID=UPI002AB223BE|nr:recombinase family protein [Clostridium butyricum]